MGNISTKLTEFRRASSFYVQLGNKTIPDNATTATTKYVPQITRGRVVKVYDGDTLTIVGYVKYNPVLYKFSVRLHGLDCAEIKTTNIEEKTIALLAKNYILNIVDGKIIELKNVGIDKYGRLLANVYYNDRHLNQELLDKHLAVEYDGGTKHIPANWVKYYAEANLKISGT